MEVIVIFICDMHSDSLTFGERERLLHSYNHPKSAPWLIFFAHFVPKRNLSPKARRAELMKMHKRYLSLISAERITPIFAFNDLSPGGIHSLFSVEGGGGLFADSPELTSLYASGLRMLGIAWDKNELCASSGEVGGDDYGLTPDGVDLVRKCDEMKIIIDISHISDRGFWDLCDASKRPFVATHSNFRAICNHRRNLTDAMARELLRRGGIVGINLYPPHLQKEGGADINDIIRHIDYGLSILGEDAVALGLDIDGTGGSYPRGLSLSSSMQDRLVNILLSHYPERVVRKIAGENVLDFLSRAL